LSRFLIIRLSSIGDIVLTTPVVRCLKKQVENAEIHYLIKEQYFSIIEHNPYIDRIWLYNNNMKELLNALEEQHFDYIIDLHHNLRTFKIKRRLKSVDYSFGKLNIEKWILVNLKLNYLPDLHIVDRYLDTLKKFDVRNDKMGLDYFLPEKMENPLTKLSDNPPAKYVVMGIGGQHATKKAPVEVLSEICDKIKFPIILSGGKEDIPQAYQIQQNVNQNKNIINSAGLLSLNETSILIRDSELVITHDTGVMHIAAAFKKKIISIWGNTIPEFGMSPYLPHPESRIFEVKGLKCRPCSKIGFESCPKNHFRCMKEQDVSEIAYQTNRLMAL
jgi:ADP-heptose:LPS heptosyltransferase